MPPTVEACVMKVMQQGGHTMNEAYAICRAAIGAEAKPKKWSDELWTIVQPFSKAERAMSKTFKGVEIARTGTFQAMTGPVTFTTKDFENAQTAYEALSGKHRAMVKLGHDENQQLLQNDGLPNAGFVENIRREGDRLVCDLVDVPDKVATLIQDGRYNSRSIEALRNAQFDGKRYPFVITGLALLGADLPAVDSLNDVAALYAEKGVDVPETDDPEAEVVMCLSQTGESIVADADVIISQLHELLDKAENIVRKQGGAPKFRMLVRSAVDELRAIHQRRIQTSSGQENNVDIKKLAKALGLADDATEEQCLAKLGELTKATSTKKEKAEADDSTLVAEVNQLKTDLADARKTIVELQSDKQATAATLAVDAAIKAGKFAPAARATLIKLAVSAPTEFEAMVQAAPEGVILATREKGKDGGGSADDVELTESEVAIAAAAGISADELKVQKLKDSGKPVPVELQKRVDEARQAAISARRKSK